MKPLFSIIIPTFNRCQLFRRSIESVLASNFPESSYELIIIDGGSTDGTVDLLYSYSHRIYYWISESDNGLYDAWNKGIKVARGDWLLFLGSDDLLDPLALARYAEFVASHPSLDYISSYVSLISKTETNRIIGTPWCWSNFRHFMKTAHVASIHRSDLFTRYGLFSLDYVACSDYEFFIRIGPNLNAGFMPHVVAFMSEGGISQSSLLPIAESRRIKLHYRAVSRLRADFDFILAASIWFFRQTISAINL